MFQFADLSVRDDHPLALELASLRSALTRFQDEAHTSSIKLQRHSLDTSNAHDRIAHLERENALLKSELSVLRSNSHPDASSQSHPASFQVQQLTISLRRLSDKLSLTEDALQARNTELAHAQSEAVKANYAVQNAYELAARTRGGEEERSLREKELEMKVRAAEEGSRMSDLVVNEYADLVRKLEGRQSTSHSRSNDSVDGNDETEAISIGTPSNNSSSTLRDSLSQVKSRLQKMTSEFSTEIEQLHGKILYLSEELVAAEAKIDAERQGAEHDRRDLANARSELEKLKIDDNSAAKMVSRYMKFSQSTTDALQLALTSLQTRHAATVHTLTTNISSISAQCQVSQSAVEKLRFALDELSGDIMRESYGRRREVALRIRILGREESIVEELRRWIRRVNEAMERGGEKDTAQSVMEKMVQDANMLLSTFDGPPGDSSVSQNLPSSYSGARARLIGAQNAVDMLVEELQAETARRLELEKVVAGGTAGVFEPLGHGQVAGDKNTRTIGGGTPALSPEEASPLVDPPQSSHKLPSNSVLDTGPDGVTDSKLCQGFLSSPSVPRPEVPVAEKGVQTATIQASQQATEEVTPAATPASSTNTRISLPPPRIEGPSTALASSDTVHQPWLRTTDDTISVVDDPHSTVGEQATVPFLTPLPLSTSAPSSFVAMHSPLIPTERPSQTQNIDGKDPDKPKQNPHHALLAELAHVNRRYDDLQRVFRDCHLTLQDLKRSISHSSESFQATSRSTVVTPPILQAALQRLDDYTEDARVELEIRTADEAILARGFETLLSVPGAISSTNIPSDSGSNVAHGSNPTESEVELQIKAFTSGTDANVQKSVQSFTQKLDDIQHDIAVLKHFVHAPDLSPSSPTSSPAMSENGGGWTSWIKSSPSRPAGSPPGSGPALTFGSIMTSPRIRHSSSLNFYGNPRNATEQNEASSNPFAALGLRLSMPAYVQRTPGVEPRGFRPRTISGVYMLGLGSRNTSGSFLSAPRQPKGLVPVNGPDVEDETGTEEIKHEDTDIE